jgi:multisubunit Na+/H+ antiporter MnhC subunit
MSSCKNIIALSFFSLLLLLYKAKTTKMIVEYPIAVSVLVSYFVLIGALVWRISPQLKQSFNNALNSSTSVLLFLVLAGISFFATWTYMIKFFIYSYSNWKIIAGYKYPVHEFSWINLVSYWLHDVSLFDSAWRQVCVGAWQWLWSHQLCSLTVAVWTPILAIEGL